MSNTEELERFKSLLEEAHQLIESWAKEEPKEFLEKNSDEFELIVKKALEEKAKGTPFEGTIEHKPGGHSFPDIIVKEIYGVEVKTVKKDDWKSTGNSIFETTRRESVEKIFIYFAKLCKKPESRYKPYEECLSDVKVTHSPRYMIDMDLKKGDAIFDKIESDYNKVRKLPNPAEPFIKHFKKTAKPGEEPWWMGNEQEASPVIIRLFSSLEEAEKKKLIVDSMILFPEIFSSSNDKYQRVAILWFVRHGVVSPNLRDVFSSKGQKNIEIENEPFESKPRIFVNLQKYKKDIFERMETISKEDLKSYWEKFEGKFDNKKKPLEQWKKHCINNCKKNKDFDEDFVKKLIGLYD